MLVSLSIDELDILVEALEALHDQEVVGAGFTKEEIAEHVEYTEAVADLSAKLSKLI